MNELKHQIETAGSILTRILDDEYKRLVWVPTEAENIFKSIINLIVTSKPYLVLTQESITHFTTEVNTNGELRDFILSVTDRFCLALHDVGIDVHSLIGEFVTGIQNGRCQSTIDGTVLDERVFLASEIDFNDVLNTLHTDVWLFVVVLTTLNFTQTELFVRSTKLLENMGKSSTASSNNNQ